jgi:hypothetical protein
VTMAGASCRAFSFASNQIIRLKPDNSPQTR